MMEALCDITLKIFIFDNKYRFEPQEERNDNSNIHELRVCMDGPKRKTVTGTGVFYYDLDIKISTTLGNLDTIFQVEGV